MQSDRAHAICVALVLASSTAGLASPASHEEVSLFDGESLYGWTQQGSQSWLINRGTLIAPPDESASIRHNTVFGDFTISLEFKAAPAAEVEVAAAACNFRSTGQPAKTAEWQSLEVTASGGVCSLRLDSVALKQAGRARRAGYITLGRRGRGEVLFRNIRVKPLNLRSLFDGSTLAGWRPIVSPNVQYGKAVWSVREEGAIHVEPGQGALESDDVFGDFILQMEIRTEPRPGGPIPNSGVFLRGAPGVFWSGYEVQIRNTSTDKYGTGGLYNIQRTRTIVPNDGEWFTLTVSACKRHFSVWVNGVPVNDWDDPNPAGDSVRKQLAMLAPGTISLQAHDPESPVSFRRILVGALETQ